jgi:xanthine dehydrogenase small subunit
MIQFILNHKSIESGVAPGRTLLDFIRYDNALTGTKIGCREGDCGACTVLEGVLENGQMKYRSIVSCLSPLGNAHGKHIVSIEGLNMPELNPAQRAFVEKGATQCGFCTPGFVVALSGHMLQAETSQAEKAIEAMNGNICRCTGYKSIERAAEMLSESMQAKDINRPIEWLVENGHIPAYFLGITERLKLIKSEAVGGTTKGFIIGGGTDLMVQRPEEIAERELNLFFDRKDLKEISLSAKELNIGAAATANDIMHSTLLAQHIPQLKEFYKLISSDPIRNMGTLAGNLRNASPIGDLSIFFLALPTRISLSNSTNEREIPLEQFFISYKKMDIQNDEYIKGLKIDLSKGYHYFNFEKVSKRTHLDIASVNSAISFSLIDQKITNCRLSMGGVSEVPLFLKGTSTFLNGKPLNPEVIKEANTILQSEISPISDVRGAKEYKRLLGRQLFYAHFISQFPDIFSMDQLV